MQIVQAPSDVLARIALPVKKIDKELLALIEAMKKTLESAKDPEGVGLAAPQVGKSIQLFIAKPSPKSKISVFINPTISLNQEQIIPKDDSDDSVQLEGCLSLKDIWGEVKRSSQVSVSYMDEEGKHHKKTIKGFLAIIIQHEYDHIQGILFPRRVLEQKGKLYKSSKNKKGEDIFEEITI